MKQRKKAYAIGVVKRMDAPLNKRTYPCAPAYPALPDYYSAAYLTGRYASLKTRNDSCSH
jgi:hypothetical protein